MEALYTLVCMSTRVSYHKKQEELEAVIIRSFFMSAVQNSWVSHTQFTQGASCSQSNCPSLCSGVSVFHLSCLLQTHSLSLPSF